MLRFEGREESHRGSTPWVSAKDKSFHPFPALPAYVLADHPPEIGYEWALTAAAAHLLECPCQGRMVMPLVPSNFHEINITWQFLQN